MKAFKFFSDNNDYVLSFPLIRRNHVRPIDDLVSMQEIAQSVRMRWVDVTLYNLQLRIYTHLHMSEVMRIVRISILPVVFEPNNQVNRERLIRLLEARFHRAYIHS
jgi:hypothetical protein